MTADMLDVTTIEEAEADYIPSQPGISWAAIAAGAVAIAALTLVLVAFGAGLGLSSVSPWTDSGVSVSSFRIGTGIYLCIVAVMSSAIGGYLAGRMRTRITGLPTNEVFFRDTAHGFLAWAFATLISATALASTTAYLANGALVGLSGLPTQATSTADPAQFYVDKLFRSATPGASTNAPNGESSQAQVNFQTRAEIVRLLKADFLKDANLTSSDRSYVAQMVAARTGMNQADAEKRVDQVVAEAKSDADNARHAAAHLSFWVTAALLFGAFSASIAAAEGGALRDGTWNDRVLMPRAI
jgi:hypothetical protein